MLPNFFIQVMMYMIDQYFGVKELYEVVLRAKAPMKFGDRYIEADEPVLYFDNVTMSVLSEDSRPIMARGGWANLPHVIWEDRTDVTFQLQEGILSNLSMGMLFNANVCSPEADPESLYVNMREGPLDLMPYTWVDENDETKTQQRYYISLSHEPILYPKKKVFIFDWANNMPQAKLYGKPSQHVDESIFHKYNIDIFTDKACNNPVEQTKQCLVDYYYEYENEALIYQIKKERFNGLFTLEGKFYSKDENKGDNYTNIIYMPKVRVVSDINLRLGERANPTMSVFNIIGMPENMGGNKQGLILKITRLNSDLEEDI